MKRKFVLALAVLLAAILVTQPYQGQALSQLDKINRQINQLQAEMNRQAHEKKYAQQNVEALSGKKQATTEEIQTLNAQIDTVGKKLSDTETKVNDTQEKLQVTGQQLEDALKREQQTGGQLDSRVRLMYTNGTVSYMDVLLNSTSFADFLGRFDAVQLITVQTRDLLDQNKAARTLVEQKKAEVTQQLGSVKTLYETMAGQKADLEGKESSKEVMVAKLSQQIVDSEEISAESEKALMDLARKMAKLQEQKNRMKTYYTGGKLAVPLHRSYVVTSPFGSRVHPISGKSDYHTGLDMAAPQGTPIYAAESGVVIVAQWWSSYGNCVIINHGGGLWTVYGHIKPGGILVKKDQAVKRGQQIALVGMTGAATGPHLHFEVRKDSKPVNPVPYIR